MNLRILLALSHSAVVTGSVQAILSSPCRFGKESWLHNLSAAGKSLGLYVLQTLVHYLDHLSISSRRRWSLGVGRSIHQMQCGRCTD